GPTRRGACRARGGRRTTRPPAAHPLRSPPQLAQDGDPGAGAERHLHSGLHGDPTLPDRQVASRGDPDRRLRNVRRDHLCRRGGRLTGSPRWRLSPAPDHAAVRTLADALGLPLPLAALLVQRGHHEPGSVRAFLRPRLDALSDPGALAGMAAAVDVIASAVRAGQRILVHGDYDVDGQCATAVLTRALRVAGGDVHPFLPHRMTDGYDFGPAGLAEAERIRAALIVTCDCGITAVEAVARAKAAGFRVVITD